MQDMAGIHDHLGDVKELLEEEVQRFKIIINSTR